MLNADYDMPKIIGFGGNKITKIIAPIIQTVSFNYREAGETSVEVLQNILNGEEVKKLNVIDTHFEEQ